MASMSINGVVSGMDWESMIDEIITNAAKPAQVQVAKKTDLTNKKSLFEEMKVMVNSISSSMSSLKLPSTYKAKEIEIENIGGTGSYKSVLTATVNADAEVNVWNVKVNQLASAQINRSKQITDSSLANTLSGVSGSTLYINAGGQKIGVEVKSNDTLDSLKSRINTTLKTLDNPIHVTASVVDNKLIFKSDYTGTGAFTAHETVNYNSMGVNTLTGFSVSKGTESNVKITNGSTSYTYGTDFTITNQNEIRWKQYDRGNEVALGDTVTVKYTMNKDDVYTKTGTYGDTEATISGFTMTDNGTLSKRVKIVGLDENGIEQTYVYGKDFTITNNKVVWLEEEEAATNEPSSYKVSYSKTNTATYSTGNVTKGSTTTTYTDEPDSYIVKYNDRATGNYDVPIHKVGGVYDSLDIDYDKLNTLYTSETGSGLNIKAIPSGTSSDPNRVLHFLDPANISDFKLVGANGNEYVYGRDYVIKTKDNSADTSNGNWQIVWGNTGGSNIGGVVNAYKTYKGVPGTVSDVAVVPSAGTQLDFTFAYDYDYSLTGRVNASDNDKTIHTIFGQDIDNFDSSKLTIRGYTNETDFKVVTASDGESEIQWIEKSDTVLTRDDAITDPDFTALQTAYNTANGTSAIPTVTLTDGNGVLRTYLDPADPSAFTMTSGGQSYEYGRDYVIRVNDDRNGYVISWAITNDANGDGKTNINDANTAVTTYTQYKKLSTQGMMASPTNGNTYGLSFSADYTTTASGTVSKTATDKSLATVLGTSVDSADYSSLSITSGSKTYTYGTDWTIDSSGNITWIDTSSRGTLSSYTADYTFGTASNFNVNVSTAGSHADVSSVPSFNAMGLDTFSYTAANNNTYSCITEEYGKAAFTMTDSSGKEYEYGKHYVLRKSSGSTNATGFQVVWASNTYWPSDTFTDRDYSMPKTGLTLSYKSSVSAAGAGSANIADVLGFTPTDYSKLAITDSDGTAYTYNSTNEAPSLGDTEFTVINGVVTVKSEAPNHPAGAYTLTYEAFDALEATTTYDSSATTQEVSITVDSGYGNYGDTALSYEQILSDTGLTSSSSDTDFAKYFTLTDGTTTYTYGTDYTIAQGSDTDSKSNEHNVVINWLSGSTPSNGAALTLTYTGRGEGGGEELTTKGVTRSATDTGITRIETGTSTTTYSPTVSDFNGGTNTITYAGKTFYEGEDFNITDSDGNATITWIKDSSGGTEWYYPTSGSTYTINHTDDNGNVTSYRATRNSSSTLNMSDYGLTTANGSISIQYGTDDWYYNLDAPDNGVGDGRTVIKGKHSVDITPTTGNSFNFRWVAPTLTSRSNLPAYGTELTVDYEYDANTFDLSDDGDGDLLYALGFTKSDGSYDDYTAAKNAKIEVDGQEYERDSNDIGETYENELIKGVTLHLKGTGYVSLDISHDAEKAITAIQTYVDNYNSLMSWMNTRMTEKELDEDAKATVDSDDFKMRWGLLHGDPLLRQTKSQMRTLMAQNFTFSFTQRKSSEEVYGTMAHNGLKTDSTLRLRIGSKYVDLTISPTDTLETIVEKLNDDSKNGEMSKFNYDDSGNKLAQPMIKAEIQNDMLVINSTDGSEITMSGSAAMNALKMNYTYRGLYQLGIATTSTDYGKSGELEFDTSKFMEALEENPDEVQTLMLKFAGEMDSWLKSMTTSSASGETSGTLTRQISDLDTRINSINEYLETYQERLDRMEERLRTQYAAAEQNFAKLSQQASSMASILQMMSGNNSGSSNSSSSS